MARRSASVTLARHAGLALSLGAALTLGACERRGPFRPKDPAPTNAGLAALTRDDPAPSVESPPDDGFGETQKRVEESARLLEQIMAQADERVGDPSFPAANSAALPIGRAGTAQTTPATQPDGTDPQTPDLGAQEPETRFSLSDFAGEDTGDESTDAGGTQPEVTITPDEPAPPLDPEQRKQQLVDELVGVLGELARSGDAPGSAALALAGLETLRPQALDELKKEGLLSEAEILSLDAARRLFDALASEGGIADPGEVSAMLDKIRQDLDARAGLRIARAVLCTKVQGFGRYEAFETNRFVAGKAQPVIVYTEVDRFGQRESAGADGQPRYEIELSERLELYHTADDLNTWNRAAETDRSVSRNRVRDYYLINQVTLPPNLTVGRYHLKVVMRDQVGGTMAEAIIPIEIVAGTRAGVSP